MAKEPFLDGRANQQLLLYLYFVCQMAMGTTQKIMRVDVVTNALGPLIFCTKCNFLQVLDLLIFLQKQPGHWNCLYAAKAVPMNGAPSSNADKAAFRRLPFSPSFISLFCLPNGNGSSTEKWGKCLWVGFVCPL